MAAKNLQFQTINLQNIPFLLLFFSSFFLHPLASQSTPQNIQVYFPILTPPSPPLKTNPSRSSGKTVAKAVGITAATSLVLLGILFLLDFMFKRRSKKVTTNPYADNGINQNVIKRGLQKGNEFVRVGGIKGVIVDEQGVDVFYWKRHEENTSFKKENLKIDENERRKSKFDFPVQEIPFLRGNSSTSHFSPVDDYTKSQSQTLMVVNPLKPVRNQEIIKSQPSTKSPPPQVILALSKVAVPPPAPTPPPRLPLAAAAVLPRSNALVPPPTPPSQPPPPPLIVERKCRVPPPPAILALSKAAVLPPAPTPPPRLPPAAAVLPRSNAAVPPPTPPPPPPPLIVERKRDTPPPPLPSKTGGLILSSRQTTLKDNISSSDDNLVKFIPLHWDKVNTNLGYSMVWHKLHNGSFRVDHNRMESLFGTMTIDNKTQRKETSKSISPKSQMKSGPTRVFLLDTRKSQNIAIVVKSLAISRSKIIDCLLKGKNLDTDTLEKLSRINLGKEEIQTILQFKDDITKLADAESFLYYILKAVPLAFTRVNIMLFKSNYRPGVSDVKKYLQTLEMACKEVKTRGLFVKLLEAVLKAGNRMNMGTVRGNAQAFNLNSLLKLSDVKSSDGKTTLLHFVVEEVIRAEGKRCNIKRNQSSSRSTAGSLSGETFTESYYIKLGLPVVGGVSSEFSNVKKAAGIDYDALSKSCLELSVRWEEISKTLEEFEIDGTEDGFVREMEMFLKGAKREIQELREEERRIMGVVKITNEYYQAGSSKDIIGGKQQLQLFVIIKGFLDMVDKACIDIAIKMQKRRPGGGSTYRSPVKFPALPENFTSSSSSSSSSSN